MEGHKIVTDHQEHISVMLREVVETEQVFAAVALILHLEQVGYEVGKLALRPQYLLGLEISPRVILRP